MNELTYILPDSLGVLRIDPAVLEHVSKYRQDDLTKPEAGGQLFASFGEHEILVTIATGPTQKDKRSRFRFFPHRPTEKKEIQKKYSDDGLHFVGDWHTHPEDVPSPSYGDIESVAEMMGKSKHDLFGAVTMVVGRNAFPEGLYVGLYFHGRMRKLERQ